MAEKRRDKGTGSVFQRASDGRWIGVLELPSTGKRRRKQVTGTTREVVVRKMRAERQALARAGNLATNAPTVEVWLATWIDREARGSHSTKTTDAYRSRLRTLIAPYIGRVRIDRLTPAAIVHMYDEIAATGRDPLPADAPLRTAMRTAYRLGMIPEDVMGRVRRPVKADHVKSAALDAEQARILLRSLADDPASLARWSVSLFTGMRQGEVLGLTRDAINLDAGTLTVQWQLQRLTWAHGCPEATPCTAGKASACPERELQTPTHREFRVLTGADTLVRPKSDRGWRVIPLAGPLAEALDKHLTSADLGPHGLVFNRPDGRPVRGADDRLAWKIACRRAGLPAYDLTLHSARHTCATLLNELNVSEQVRMQIMGHSTAAVHRIYADVTGGMAAAAAEALGKLLDTATTSDARAEAAATAEIARFAGRLTTEQRAELLRLLDPGRVE